MSKRQILTLVVLYFQVRPLLNVTRQDDEKRQIEDELKRTREKSEKAQHDLQNIETEYNKV